MKRNQIMITALAIMIAVAGYLNFAGSKIKEETLVVTDDVMTEEEMTALLDLSEDDIVSDIDSMDEELVLTENYTSEEMVIDTSANVEEELDEVIEGTPGEAVFTSTQAVSTLSAAKLLKEQTRAKNQEMLESIVNNEVLDSAQKQEAVEDMVKFTRRSEMEMEAEILLSAKGFTETVVSIGENNVDVVVCQEDLTDAHLAQIMDIVTRKTGISAENVIISRVTQK